MQLQQLWEIQNLPDNMRLSGIAGRITKLHGRKAGQNSVGEWSLQNGEISDGQTVIQFQLKDREELPQSYLNADVTIEAINSKQHGLTGIAVFDDNYKGTVTRKIKITPTAQIMMAGGAQQPAPQQTQPQQQYQQQAPPQQAPQQQYQQQAPQQQYQQQTQPQQRSDAEWDGHGTNQPAQAPARPTKEEEARRRLYDCKRSLIQICNLHTLCRIIVERQEAPLVHAVTGRTMSESEMQAATASIFIKADKLGMNSDMPNTPFTTEDFKS